MCRLGGERAAFRFLVLKLPLEKMKTYVVLGNSELVDPEGDLESDLFQTRSWLILRRVNREMFLPAPPRPGPRC